MAIPISGTRIGHGARAFFVVKSGDFGASQPALPSVGAASTSDLLITVSKTFKPQSPVLLARPAGTADPAGLTVESCDCIAPAAGSYAAGNHPRIRVRFQNATAGALSPATQQYEFTQE